MFGKKRQEKIAQDQKAREAQARFERNESVGKEIYAGIADLKNVPRDNLPDAAFVLFMQAKQQSELIRRSIENGADHDFTFGGVADSDFATYLAQGVTGALRDHVTRSQTFFEAISEQLPDVHFTIEQQDAISMVAAMLREQRLEGILQGLRLAGLLTGAPDRRRTSLETDEI
ncbi:hypothetical protein [Bradyrhizobium sp. STM 3562]|uniref:hypothetical protein n=1 Tax=Bradyrhizobium sp. STM 3562 TaxID=578924 RepID=UPI00388F0B10